MGDLGIALPSRVGQNPSIFCDLKAQAKVWNPSTTPKVVVGGGGGGEEEEEEISTHADSGSQSWVCTWKGTSRQAEWEKI